MKTSLGARVGSIALISGTEGSRFNCLRAGRHGALDLYATALAGNNVSQTLEFATPHNLFVFVA